MIKTLHLFRPLHNKLMELLRSLSPDDWVKNTVAGNWTIKDVTTHLLDTSLRAISLYRDQWELPPVAISDYQSLVNHLNRLNAEWVTATRRLSPAVLIGWLDSTHEAYIQSLEKLEPDAPARYSVAWAGESSSTNAFHVAREYTERWHHQQQIREAVGRQEILSREFYHPVIDTFMMALPHAYRNADAPAGTAVSISVTTEAGGEWTIERTSDRWMLVAKSSNKPVASLSIPGELAWKLFTKAVTPEAARSLVTVTGPDDLAWPGLRMLSVMA